MKLFNGMRLLGIYVKQMSPSMMKVLKPGWYPFGDYPEPKETIGVIISKEREIDDDIYQYEGLPKISVNCIVGKNGAGKSTLLDMMYRIINNFTCTVLGKERIDNQHGRRLEYARGVNASLYFEIEGSQFCIECIDTAVSLFKKESVGAFVEVVIDKSRDPKLVLSEFFYTISTNYSIYSLNEKDYEVSGAEYVYTGICGSWIKGLFHKNDGYLTPIVITPFRNQGSIDVAKENNLARQRIVALTLLSKSQGHSFIEDYDAVEFSYSLDLQYQEKILDGFAESVDNQYKGLHTSQLIEAFNKAWEEKICSENVVDLKDKDFDRYNIALFYLGYKTFKICMTYDDFWKEFDVDSMLNICLRREDEDFKESDKRFYKFLEEEVPSRAKKVLAKIQQEIDKEQGSHITLKVEVCLKYLISFLTSDNALWADNGAWDIDDMLDGKHLETYNDAVKQLPPPFFDFDVKFVAKNDKKVPDSSWGGIGSMENFTIEQMSSGERQMLNMVSYVLYHIKNIQSIKDDDNRVKYHNICLIFDEAELYFHPEYQRNFLSMLLESLQWCHIDTNVIRSVQILIVTHSPFVLSDMLRENMMYLDKGVCKPIPEKQIFGANLYQLMADSFFFTENAMGKVASLQVSKWIEQVNKGGEVGQVVLNMIGDTIIRNYLLRKMEDNRKRYVQD